MERLARRSATTRLAEFEALMLICNTEWELRPTSPAAIRLIHFGKLLDDKQLLRGMYTSAIAHILSGLGIDHGWE